MPYNIVRNGPGCKGEYAVVGPSGTIGCHKSRRSAINQQRALYAAEANSKKSEELDTQKACWDGYVQRGMKPGAGGRMVPNCVPVSKLEDCCPDLTKAEEWEGKPLYDELSDAEQMLADSLLKLAEEAGPLDKADGIWVGYVDGANNENASIGVKCGNCALHKSSVACAILEMPIEEEGACRFAVIPDGYVSVENNMEDMDDMENYMDMEDEMSKRSLEDLDLKPTESMANNARRGLELRRKFGRGGTAVGVARARDLMNRNKLSPSTVLRK